jgi:hypothetical protein
MEDIKMKKFKKFLSIVLATLLAMSIIPTSMSAFAASSSDPKTKLTVYKTVKVDESSWGALLPTEQFEISMVPATADQLTTTDDSTGEEVKKTDINGNELEIGPALKTPTLTFDFDATDSTSSGSVEKSGDFKFEFDEDFTHTGVYRYYITETANSSKSGYIDYDETEYTVDLYVQQDDDGNYFVSDYIVIDTAKNAKPTKVSFTNEIYCADLVIAKNVEGVEYQKDELYTFRILIPVGGTTITLEQGQKFQAEILDKNNGLVKDDRTNSTGILDIVVNGTSLEANMSEGTTFQLKAGEKLKILGAPVSMVYKVEEVTDTEQFQKEGYTVYYDYVEQGTFATDKQNTTLSKQEGNSVVGTVNTSKNEVHFINERIIETPTGVALEVLPYALVALVALCGIAFIIYKKRRTAQE